MLAALAIIIVPMLLDGSAQDRDRVVARIPEPPGVELRKLTLGDIDRKMKQIETESTAKLSAPVVPEKKDDTTLDGNELPVSWSLQLGSFKHHENALKLRDDLRASDFRSYIIAAQTDKGDVYRVFVGPVLEKSRLTQIGQQIESRFDLKGQVVRYRIEDDAGQLGG